LKRGFHSFANETKVSKRLKVKSTRRTHWVDCTPQIADREEHFAELYVFTPLKVLWQTAAGGTTPSRRPRTVELRADQAMLDGHVAVPGYDLHEGAVAETLAATDVTTRREVRMRAMVEDGTVVL
jgi:hypothetical protein